jgi:putative glutamine amidotransferase
MADFHALPGRQADTYSTGRKPLVGVLCNNRSFDGRPAQAVANRFVQPLAMLGDLSVLLVPVLPDAVDAARFAGILDGLLLTGACSHLAASRYGGTGREGPGDEGRDEVALRLAGRMIEAGRPVFGICRGLQELNVLFGGTLSPDAGSGGHHRGIGRCDGDELEVAELFDHHHDVEISGRGMLDRAIGQGRHRVNSVHYQGIDRLGDGLSVEARAPDGLIEAISAAPCGGPVVGVQWHPEWDAGSNPASQAFFRMMGASVRGEAYARADFDTGDRE